MEERDSEQEFPLEIFLSAAAVGWLLRRCRVVDSRGVGWGWKKEKDRRRTREREKIERHRKRVMALR